MIESITALDGTAYTRRDLERMFVKDLRKLAREVYTGENKSIISYVNKEQLLDLLFGDGDQAELPGIIERETPVVEEELPPRRLPEPPKDSGGNGTGNGDLADILARALQGRIKAGVDESQVKAIVADVINGAVADQMQVLADKVKKIMDKRSKELLVVVPDKPKVEIGIQHFQFESMLKLAAARLDMFLVGPAGSGKTYACEAIAKALDLPFYMVSVGLQTTKTDLLGYMDVRGQYVSTMLRRAFEGGGVFIMDEIDAGNPNVLTVINAMLSNAKAAFPDGMVERHPDFIFIAAGNTYGHGGDIQYVGRNQIDAATLDRFVLVEFHYDEKLEETFTDDAEWLETVRSVRRAAVTLREKLIVSPRATIKGTVMKKMGYRTKQCLDMLVYRGISKDIKDRVEAERVKS